MGGIRVGFVSTFNSAEGTATVTYPDRCNEVTGDLLVLSPLGLPQTLKPGEMVLVVHLDSGTEEGVVIGGFSGTESGASISVSGGNLMLSDSSGSTTLGKIISKLGGG